MGESIDAKKRVLISLFGADDGYTGFKNIVHNLVNEGRVLTTPEAYKIDFGPMRKFMLFGKEDEDGLVLIKFNFDWAYASDEFISARDIELNRLKKEVGDLEKKLTNLKRFIDNLSS